jgi:ankyrin repeat protein
MTMTKISLNLIVSVLSLAYLSACGSEMNDHIQKMDSAEKKFNEAQSREVVAFMSLDVMFPNASVRALAKAAGDGDVKKVEQLVNGGVSVNSRGAQGATPLFWAMHNLDGFKKLLELGADPNVVYADGNSVMKAAVVMKDRGILKAALEHGGNPNLVSSDSFGYTPIFDAMSAGLDVVDMLLSAGADINAKGKFGATPVLVAAGRGDYEMVYRLLERGADYRLKDARGVDLAAAVSKNVGRLRSGTKWAKWQEKVIEWLQAKGVEIPASPQRRQ